MFLIELDEIYGTLDSFEIIGYTILCFQLRDSWRVRKRLIEKIEMIFRRLILHQKSCITEKENSMNFYMNVNQTIFFRYTQQNLS